MTNDESRYRHREIEGKWRAEWEKTALDTPDILQAKRPFYNLMMFPYPSAEGLHVGNMYAFTGADIYGRFKRMQGYDVFEPIGLDGFGIHSENYAFKVGRHPMDQAAISERHFYNQLHTIGAMYDWKRTLETYDPDYYRWTQWLFIQMFKHGLAYRGKGQVNWCPGCKTVLADEQVIEDKCERCGNLVYNRALEQWFFKITAYAEKLLKNLSKLDWSEKVKLAQERWIGKKEGINIKYPVVDETGKRLSEVTCFTTRPDTNFGATFVAIAPEHPLVAELLNFKFQISNFKLKEINDYLDQIRKKSNEERAIGGRKKTGVFTGLYCVNQLNNYKMPLYISDFVVMEVGTGAVVGVPGHDRRDFEFAQAMKLPIIRVVVGPDGNTSPITKIEEVQEESGVMINSDFLNGLEIHEATQKMMNRLEKEGWGKRATAYHLRDWLISRQRYWGPPIPMIFCENCKAQGRGERQEMPGWWTVPEKDLPVLLPRIEDYKPGDDGVPPLAKHKEFYETSCPGCRSKAVRETEVSDTFLDSSWYFLKYPSLGRSGQGDKGAKLPWDPSVTQKWLPVDMYTGGAEHSVLHLLYSRFVCMALHDMGFIDFDEPFTSFYAHGLVIKDGAKMSKSKGNVVTPDEYISSYGADALRLYLMFTGPYDQGGDFRDAAMEGMHRWVQRVWKMSVRSIAAFASGASCGPLGMSIRKALHRTIKKVGEDIERRRYNTAIAAMMELVNEVSDSGGVMALDDLNDFLKILAPFAPYMTEELYQRARAVSSKSHYPTDSIHRQPWPSYDLRLLEEDTAEVVVQVNGKLRDTIEVEKQKAKGKGEVEKVARASRRVARHLEGKTVKKVVFVPGRLINFVTG